MLSLHIGNSSAQGSSFSSPARQMDSAGRLNLSLDILARQRLAQVAASVTDLAASHGVSRQFCYEQAAKAQAALEQAFAPGPEAVDGQQVLFYLPVTPDWIRQFVLAQQLIGHTSIRGVQELAETLLDYDLSVGTIHNIAQEAVEQARSLNRQEDLRLLPRIKVGAHDEIFQSRQPVLVGIDVKNTYCYLLAQEEHRDAVSWGVHLLDLRESGLNPERTVADAGSGLRSAQAEVWKDVPCQGDVFHIERALGEVAFYLDGRARTVLGIREALAGQLERCQRDYGTGARGRKRRQRARALGRRLAAANREVDVAVPLADDIALLSRWLQEDVLALAGEDLATRRELYDYLVAELAAREKFCPHRIGPVVRMLQEQREQLLAFVGVVDAELEELAERLSVPLYLVREVCRLAALDRNGCLYWLRRQQLQQKLGWRWREVEEGVAQVLSSVTRASSMVENINSRLRCYFFLRRQIGGDYLELLRFFLNHRVYERSRRARRVGKSPAQLLGDQEHPHWLEMLGYRRFSQN
jgi:hypothetical protein